MKKSILTRLKEDIVLGAEGYVFELERRGYIKAGPYVPEVVLDYPDALRQLHREFLRAGAEVMVALTYYAHREKLKDVGRENDLEKLNRQAVHIAQEVAAEGEALVAGNICNTWAYEPDNPQSARSVERMYQEQIGWAVDEGIDFVISETNDYLGEALIALKVVKGFNLPAMVTLATVQPEKTRDGLDYVEACEILEANGADIVGFNCDRGPATLLPLIKKLRKRVKCFIAAQPVPYRTTRQYPTFESLKREGVRAFPVALEPFLLTRFEMADYARQARDVGVNYIGSCCGTAPHITRAMAEALGREVPASQYSPQMSLHPMIGKETKKANRQFIKDWKD